MAMLLRAAKTVAGLLFRRPLISVAVIGVDGEGRIALQRRRDNGLWGLPGGLVDWGETLKECAARELAEEVGLEITSFGRMVGAYSDVARDPRLHAVVIVVVAEVAGEIRAADRDEVLEARMVDRAEIEADLGADRAGADRFAFDHARHLRDFLQGAEAVLA